MLSRVLEHSEGHHIQSFAWPKVANHRNGNGRGHDLPCTKVSSAGSEHRDGTASIEDRDPAAEQRIRDAYDRGTKEGEASARRAAADQLAALVERLGTTLVELADAHDRALRQVEPGLVKLAVEIARRILHRELTIDPGAVEGLFRAGIEKLVAERVHTVRLHPDLEPAVRECVERIAEGRQFEIISDPAQAPGTLILQTEQGDLDASMETQLREIERGLTDGLPQ